MLDPQRREAELQKVLAVDATGLLHDRVETAIAQGHDAAVGIRHERVHDDHHVRARLSREIGVAAEAHAAVHVVATAHRVGLEEARNRRGGRDRLADRHVAKAVASEDDALRPVEVDRRDEELAIEFREGVLEPERGERLANVDLERRQREESGGQVALGGGQHVGNRLAHARHGVLADGPEEPSEPARRVAERVRGVDGAAPEVQGVLEILVDDAIDLGGPHAVGEQRGHDRARAAANVDVEAARAVEPLLDRGDHADLVHAADDTAARQGQRVALTPRPPPFHHALEEVHDSRFIVISRAIDLPVGPLPEMCDFTTKHTGGSKSWHTVCPVPWHRDWLGSGSGG